ncbi:MAG TPA: hypothetical protein VKT49_23505 [Bryobacteraceae bacterium]|nr:hypothetical protein [Bryobacteraceae bacterium]
MRTLAVLLLTVPLCAEITHLHRVNDHIYIGKQPHPPQYSELAQMGIKTVLDLRGGRFHKPRERKQVEAAGMRYISMRLSGIFPPEDQQVAGVLSVLNDPERWPVFMHCWRGDDRVGLVIACYRMTHDHWSNRQALAEARSDGLNRLEILLQRYIRHFDPSRPAFREQAAAAATSR